MLKKFFVVVGVLWMISSQAQDSVSLSSIKVKPEDKHEKISQTVTALLSNSAYHKVDIDDGLSKKILKEFLADVDYNRSFFLQTDIDEFKKSETLIDDYLKGGRIDFAFTVYNRFIQRADERINYTFELLKDSMDFSVIDSFQIRRQEANWVATKKGMDELWKNKIKYECIGMLATGKNWKETSEVVYKRYNNFRKQLIKTKNEDVFGLFMNSFTTIIDPHTNYFSPRVAEDFNINSSLSLEGIGATLQTEGEYTKVREVVKGGPADKSGEVGANDRIVAVAQGDDGAFVDMIGWRIDDVVSKIRGKKGTVVRLKMIDAKASPTDPNKIVRIVRDKIKLEEQAAKGSIEEIKRGKNTYKAGVIQVPSFYYDFEGARRGEKDFKSTSRDVKNIIDSLSKIGIDGVVLDLRNNGGGALLEAIKLTGLFIKTGPVVEIRNIDGSIDVEKDDDASVAYGGPLVVLVNRFSASASEIVSAAIQDYNRGVVVGEQTHGKGTVQNLVGLDRFINLKGDEKAGQLKVTIAKFYRINGSSTQIKGVIPDVALPSIYADKEFGEDESPYALPWDQIRGTNYVKVTNLNEMRSGLVSKHRKRIQNDSAYIHLIEDINTFQKSRQRQYVSISLKEYKKEIEVNEAKKKFRKATVEQLEKKGVYRKDLILSEGLEVLLDFKLSKA